MKGEIKDEKGININGGSEYDRQLFRRIGKHLQCTEGF